MRIPSRPLMLMGPAKVNKACLKTESIDESSFAK